MHFNKFILFISMYLGLAVTSDNRLVTMCDCGNGRGIPRKPSLYVFSVDGDVLSVVPLQLPLLEVTKLRFMDTCGDYILISDLGKFR